MALLPLEREEPLLEREALLRARVDADGLERADDLEREGLELDEPPEERELPLPAPLLADPFFVRALLEADLVLAIRDPSSSEDSTYILPRM